MNFTASDMVVPSSPKDGLVPWIREMFSQRVDHEMSVMVVSIALGSTLIKYRLEILFRFRRQLS